MSDGRDLKGRFIKGRDASKESIETQIKRISSLKESWREREDYISDLIQECPYIYNSWRGLKYSKNGGLLDKNWYNFKNFYQDVRPTYKSGLVFRRLDKSRAFFFF